MSAAAIHGVPRPTEAVTVLLVSPSQDERSALREIFARSKWVLQEITSCSEAGARIRTGWVPVVICDRELSDGDWKTLLTDSAESPFPPRIIVACRLADDALWAEVLNLGGYDVLQAPFDPTEVLRVSFLAWESWKHERERKLAKPPAPSASRKPATRATAG